MRHLLSPLDLSVDELARLLDLARDISKDPSKYGHVSVSYTHLTLPTIA